jgi:hypothetical protein
LLRRYGALPLRLGRKYAALPLKTPPLITQPEEVAVREAQSVHGST